MSMTIGGHGQQQQQRVDPNNIEALYTAQQQQQQRNLTAPRQQQQHLQPQPQYNDQSQSQTSHISLSRQKSDTSYDRTRPFISRRVRYDSESENEQLINDFMMRHGTNLGTSRNNGFNASNTSIDSALQFGSSFSQAGSRPITPAFPQVPGTPYFNQSGSGHHTHTNGRSHSLNRNGALQLTQRSHSPAGGSMYQGHNGLDPLGRRGSVSSEPQEVSPIHVKLVKDNYKFWYKPNISREDAISMLQHRSAGTFVVRDSNSFPGAFGLALKVATPPAQSKPGGGDSNELVRHFLIAVSYTHLTLPTIYSV